MTGSRLHGSDDIRPPCSPSPPPPGAPEAVAQLMRGWVLVLTLVNLILANAIVCVISQGWP